MVMSLAFEFGRYGYLFLFYEHVVALLANDRRALGASEPTAVNDVQLPCRVIDLTSSERPLVMNVAPSLLVVSVHDDERNVRVVWVDICAFNL